MFNVFVKARWLELFKYCMETSNFTSKQGMDCSNPPLELEHPTDYTNNNNSINSKPTLRIGEPGVNQDDPERPREGRRGRSDPRNHPQNSNPPNRYKKL